MSTSPLPENNSRAGYAESVLVDVIATAVLPWMIEIYPGDESEATGEERMEMAQKAARSVIAALDEKGWPEVL